LTSAGEQYGKDIYDLFTADGYYTLGEYNAPSECSKRDGHFADKLISIAYYGKDVLGLCQWIQHGACNSSLPKWGNYILQDLVCLP